MGARFDIQHINFIAYITAEGRRRAPRSEEGVLWAFLGSLGSPSEIQRHTISNDADWQRELQQQAIHLQQPLSYDSRNIVEERRVADILDPLRNFFTGYELYVLLVPSPTGGPHGEQHINHLFKKFVDEAKVDILVLLPYCADTFINIVDPFPALQALAASPVLPPAAVFWTKSDAAVAMSLGEAEEFFHKNVADDRAKGERLDRAISEEARKRAGKRILHISDLHFGNPAADRRRSYLKQHLSDLASKVDRVVISGDLFDEPKPELRALFDEFYADLTALTRKTPILIPGNHDVRRSGNQVFGLGRNSEQFVDLPFEPLVVDDNLKAVFFCFNSCEGGNFATGLVTEKQRLDRGTAFELQARRSEQVRDYVRIAVVHHHPYNYSSEPTVFYEKLLAAFSNREDRFVAFQDAKAFLSWCGARDVSLILHGHKHVPHVVMAEIEIRERLREIMIVGCGSSTGVEEKPMCYDVITLDPVTRRWTASFYYDPTGDGAGFDIQNITLDFRTGLPQDP